MSIGSFLLHAVLCLSLLLNGSAHAMSLKHSAPSRHARITTPPCHAPEMGAASSPEIDKKMQAGSLEQHPDCCKSGACKCACGHTTPATLTGFGGDSRGHWHVNAVRPGPSLYVSPTPGRRIRPPIV